MHSYRMRLWSVGNPDFGQYAPLSTPVLVSAFRLSALREALEKYIDEWDLGGGNCPSYPVMRDGIVIGHFSYNRRFWRLPKTKRRPEPRRRRCR